MMDTEEMAGKDDVGSDNKERHSPCHNSKESAMCML